VVDIEDDCSREDSRELTNYFSKHIFPKLPSNDLELPSNCPFHPMYNMYFSQEKNKTKVSRQNWKCGFCGKQFKSEFYLDRHMRNKHVDKLDHGLTHDTGCVADLCPLLGCRTRRRGKQRTIERRGGAHFEQEVPCTTADLERAKFRCENLMRKCFPLSLPLLDSGLSALETFRENICGSLRCVNGALTSAVDYQMQRDAENGEGSVGFLTILSWALVIMLLGAVLIVGCLDRKRPLVGAANVHKGVRVALKTASSKQL